VDIRVHRAVLDPRDRMMARIGESRAALAVGGRGDPADPDDSPQPI
jgi:hypothetical protein